MALTITDTIYCSRLLLSTNLTAHLYFSSQYVYKIKRTIQSFYLWLYSSLLERGKKNLFPSSFYTVGRTPWTGEVPVTRPLPAKTQNKRTQTSMPQVEFELTITVFEHAKTVHALDSAATVIGKIHP
jgi:hypothetical protein